MLHDLKIDELLDKVDSRYGLAVASTLVASIVGQARGQSTLFAVLYHLTGEEKYRDAVIKPGGGQKYLTASGGSYFPASDHWLLSQPPKRGQ